MNSKDKKILEAIREGKDDASINWLYSHTFPKIKNHILKNGGDINECKDIFHDAIIILFRQIRLQQFNENHDIDGYMYVISKNLWIKRALKKSKHVAFDQDKNDVPDISSFELEVINEEKKIAMQQMMSRLGDKCKELLNYSAYMKLSMKEICLKMGFPNENAAKTQNYKCKQKLMHLIKDNKVVKSLFE